MKRIIKILSVLLILIQCSAFAQEKKIITRLEFTTYIMGAVGITDSSMDPGFSDLDRENRYYPYIAAAKEYGIINGYQDLSFKPNTPITRQDAAVILCRAYKIEPIDSGIIKGFKDYNAIAGYAKGYVAALVQNGIVGYKRGEEFRAKATVTLQDMEITVKKCDEFLKSTLNFKMGYPKEAVGKRYGAISVSIKTTKPCTVYYKLVPADLYLVGYKPNIHEVNNLLTAVSRADVAIDVPIYIKDLEKYDLYITAVDKDGKYTGIEKISGVMAHRYIEGRGTKNEPYLIYNEEQLRGIEHYPDAYFRLEEDINLKNDWQPITIKEKGYLGFAGELDGNYHKITGMKIKTHNKNAGLFSALYGGRVTRLYVDGDVSANSNGGIIAGVSEGGRISRCIAVGRVMTTGNNAGGIVGTNNGEVIDSVSAVYMVKAGMYAGGISGANRGDIKNSLSAAYSVSADMYASAVAGVNVGGNIFNNVCAGIYADDIITTKTGRITTNKQYGKTRGNYCYDKMICDSTVNIAEDTHDGLDVSWEELTSLEFYSDIMSWDVKDIWGTGLSEEFRLISLKGFGEPDLIKGITVYSPMKISTARELMRIGENTEYHYILTDDISLKSSPSWTVVCQQNQQDTGGFNGTFDGNGHSISGMRINNSSNGMSGMFGVISAGVVRNLTLTDIYVEGEGLAGTIAGENYGYIENCSVEGNISITQKGSTASAGGVAGNNYGFIENTISRVNIHGEGQALTLGGVTAANEGFIDNTEYCGKIYTEKDTENANGVIGGISGMNSWGMIYNCRAEVDISSGAYVNYLGGIAGIVNSGEIYKGEFSGSILAKSPYTKESSAYVGGITGLIPGGLIVDSVSGGNVVAYANNVYLGGVAGYNQGGTVQNTYAKGSIEATGGVYDDSAAYVGGVCGYAEAGFISENVVLLKDIITNGFMAVVSNIGSDMASCYNNYAVDNIKIKGEISEISNNGEQVDEKKVHDRAFFFTPVAEGGKLGWNLGDVWEMREDSIYPELVK